MNTETLSIADLTGDMVVYRDLQPCDARLPAVGDLRDELGLPAELLPRKRDPEYARVLLALANRALALADKGAAAAFLVIGDTDNDRRLAAHLREASKLPVPAFIGVDRLDEIKSYVYEGDTIFANRWELLERWLQELDARGLPWSATVVLIDIDKTLLGPRGRNDGPVDESRADGAVHVARELLGATLDEAAFRQTYAELCRKAYHPMTLDNQDLTVYSSLLLAGGALSLAELRAGIESGELADFLQVLAVTCAKVPAALADLHTTIGRAYAAGDPTPFKQFRRAEYAAAIARMRDGRLALCREVVDIARKLLSRGALCVAASDKPSEASLPDAAQAAAGMLPLHRMPAALR
jgi:hypothetical protein